MPTPPGEETTPYPKWDWKDEEECFKIVPNTYGQDEELIFEGSGGPTHDLNNAKGGKGGGFVSISAEQNLTLIGNISAEGGNAEPDPVYVGGSGGGSGGSIMIVTTFLKGNGIIDVTGGNGGKNNSGGGAGGRVSIRFRQSQNKTLYPAMTKDWNGTVVRLGGQGFNTGGNGSLGSIFTTKCQAGYSGEF